ncbi:MAG: ABC transporter permease subunit [Bdellovibrionota bacterium]
MTKFIYPILFAIVVLFLWQFFCIAFNIPAYLLPKPTEIILSLFKYKIEFLRASMVTFSVTLVAIMISVIAGSCISILIFFNKFLEKAISPYLIIIQIMPIISIIPLLIIWFKSNIFVTLIICASICSVFPIISAMSTGFKNTDKSLLMIFDIHQASKMQKLFRLYLPSSLPFFLNGLQISSALALIGSVSAEFIAGTGGRNSGVAYLLLMAGYNLQTDKLFASLFVITILGLVIHFIFRFIKRWALRNY